MDDRSEDEKRKLAQIMVLIAEYMKGKDAVQADLGFNGDLYKLSIIKSKNPDSIKDDLARNINWDSNFEGPEGASV